MVAVRLPAVHWERRDAEAHAAGLDQASARDGGGGAAAA